MNEKIKLQLRFDDKYLYYIKEHNCTEKFLWDSVIEVFAFKRDLFSVDLICIGFRVDTEGTFYEIDEEMSGYNDVVKFLEMPFDGINVDWFSEVAHPAFETNLLSLWGDKKIEKIWNKK